MAFYTKLTALAITLIFVGCNATPDISLSPRLKQYANIEENCQDLRLTPGLIVPDSLDNECRDFLKRLDKANVSEHKVTLLAQEHSTSNPSYIEAKTEANRQHRKTEVEHKKLATLLNKLSLQAIEEDDLSTVVMTLKFNDTVFTKRHYDYYKKQSASFQEDPQYLAFEKEYATTLIRKGLHYLSLGDKKRALKLFKRSAELNNYQAEFLVGIIYEAKNIDKSITWHTRAKEHGVDASIINLARLYLRKHDSKTAQQYYLEAAEAENAYAQYILYQQYKKTDNPKAHTQAMPWIKRAANNGFPPAQYSYALELLKSAKTDEAEAWLLKARSNGITAANAQLGALYYKQKAYDKAVEPLSLAKDAASKYKLAKMYELGRGVELNYYHAYVLYKEAVKLGRKKSKKDVKRLSKLKTSKEQAHYDAALRKEKQHVKALASKNGATPILRNLREKGLLIRLKGFVSMPLKKAHGFMLTTESGKPFYIIDTNQKAHVSQYQYIDISAKATGTAVTISDDQGTTVDVYQLIYEKACR